MPEGPSIVILKEELKLFNGKKVLAASGSTASFDVERLKDLKVIDIKSWGKHLLICFAGFFIRIHLLMFGTYRINETKALAPRLHLTFMNGEVNFYTCSIRLIEGDANQVYNWERDTMSDLWNEKKAEQSLKDMPATSVSDALLNQELFGGVGNIIKNEVLFRIHVHPESTVHALPVKLLRLMIKEAHVYSLDFYKWKKDFELKKHWQIYKQKMCPRCKIKPEISYVGKTKRLTYACPNCQKKYG